MPVLTSPRVSILLYFGGESSKPKSYFDESVEVEVKRIRDGRHINTHECPPRVGLSKAVYIPILLALTYHREDSDVH